MRLFYSSIEKWKMKGGIYYSIGHEDIKDIKIATRYTAFSFIFCLIISDSLPLKKREKLI